MEMIDLSRVIYDGMPKIPVLPDVHVQRCLSLEKGHPLNVTEISLACHAGTHVDAPVHIIDNGKSIEEIPLEDFVGPGAIIPVKKRGGEEVTARDLEDSGVPVSRGDILMLFTGWDEKFESPDYNIHPYLSIDAAEWIVGKGVKLLGIDCITVDLPTPMRQKGFEYPVHRILLGNGVLIAENVANLGKVAGKKSRILALPLKVKGSDAGHARIVAEILN
ncbi:MAG: cyclase family protein [Deltaproteobacteria bacterium]|nr:cyclase family protein [Deltaproteobacteria bacterium]MCZ6621598.1 cyclase family protein [Deltaproteobacteria bacterium]